jgi:hypothetical protein
MSETAPQRTAPRLSSQRRLWAQLRLALPFYLGLGAPGRRRAYPDCTVRAAPAHSPDLIRALVRLRRGEAAVEGAQVEEINFRCASIALPGAGRFFVKDFPRGHLLHDVERALHCSRLDRAWRAAHLLPRLGLLTPRAVGTAETTDPAGPPIGCLVTEWLPDALPYPDRLRRAAGPEARLALLAGFAREMRRWNDAGVYLRDLVKNVLARETAGGVEYWLTDLDQLHPIRRLTKRRLLHQVRQLAFWSGPLAEQEARAAVLSYLGVDTGRTADVLRHAMLSTPPACDT